MQHVPEVMLIMITISRQLFSSRPLSKRNIFTVVG